MRERLGLLTAMLLGLAVACDDGPDDAREGQVASVLASADEPLIRARDLFAGDDNVPLIQITGD
jgi:hypothetical protein